VTRAVLVNDPKRPKTKPATAMAAMSVIAMRMTVARTGEIAFLLAVRVWIRMLFVTWSLWEDSGELGLSAVG